MTAAGSVGVRRISGAQRARRNVELEPIGIDLTDGHCRVHVDPDLGQLRPDFDAPAALKRRHPMPLAAAIHPRLALHVTVPLRPLMEPAHHHPLDLVTLPVDQQPRPDRRRRNRKTRRPLERLPHRRPLHQPDKHLLELRGGQVSQRIRTSGR